MKKIVFRVANVEDLEKFKNLEFDDLVKSRHTISFLNNFTYDENKKYIHLFENETDALFYYSRVLNKRHPEIKFCLVALAVSKSVLKKCEGYGQYSFKKDVVEYAIEQKYLTNKIVKYCGNKKLKQQIDIFER